VYLMISTYTVPLEEVDKQRDAHLAFLDAKQAAGVVVEAGRQDPPTGGVVILNVASEAEAFAVMADDPYVTAKVGEYRAVGFNPMRGALKDWKP
jgi:uncharacterized protein YciI